MNWTVRYPVGTGNVMERFKLAGFSVIMHQDSIRAISAGYSEISYIKLVVVHTQECAMTHWLLANADIDLRIVDD